MLPTDLLYICREVIHVTRSAGYNYLWINSLCITQGSEEDWQNETVNVAVIYALIIMY